MHAFSLEVMNGIKNSQKKKPVLNKSFIFFRSQQNWVKLSSWSFSDEMLTCLILY